MSESPVREPAVAGFFYPDDAATLRREVEGFLAGGPGEPSHERLAFVPHAGYRYSGAIAGEAFRELTIPSLVVVLAPNHHGIGAPLALPTSGQWRTPLGRLGIDEDASRAITEAGASSDHRADFRDDWVAHSRDHALEVELPLLQVASPRPPSIVTLAVGTYGLEELLAAGRAIAAGLASVGRTAPEDVLIVVSSDMSHHVPAERALQLDEPVLRLVESADAEGVHRTVTENALSVCGFAPAVVGLAAARELGVGPGRLVRYGNSGDVTGDDSQVVAYASILLPAAA